MKSCFLTITIIGFLFKVVLSAPNPDNPPFVSEGVAETPWGPGHATWPEKLFWEYTDTSKFNEARGASDGVENDGLAPVLGAVAWGNEYKDGRPGGANSTKAGWQQFGEWIAGHRELLPVDASGAVWQLWGDTTGYISPLMPLDQKDWPAGVQNAVWSDWVADRLGRLCARVHLRGWFAADFVEGIPHVSGREIDFNPRIIAAFEKWANVTVPGSTVKARADYIKANLTPQWNDYWCNGFAYWYAALGMKIKALTGKEPFMAAQTHMWPAERRYMGTDFRIYLKYMKPQNWYFQVELQSDGMRNVPPWGSTLVRMGQFACREPAMPLGAHMDADLGEFREAVVNTKPVLTDSERTEWGDKYLRHHWFTVGWAHVANRDGSVRRATQAFLRHYWDAGGVDTSMVRIIREVIPRHPFGPASYYSVAIERKFERQQDTWDAMQSMEELWQRAPVGYFVSDAALDSLQRTNYPSAWIVSDKDSLPADERAKLERIAPVVSSVPAGSPVSFDSGSAGFAFVDQSDRVILVVTNISDAKVARTVSVHLKEVETGTFSAVDLMKPSATYSFQTVGGTGVLTFPLERWDTRALAISGLRKKTGVHQGQKTVSSHAVLNIVRVSHGSAGTSVRFHVSSPGWINLTGVDMRGRVVTAQRMHCATVGEHEMVISRSISRGIMILRMGGDQYRETVQLMVGGLRR